MVCWIVKEKPWHNMWIGCILRCIEKQNRFKVVFIWFSLFLFVVGEILPNLISIFTLFLLCFFVGAAATVAASVVAATNSSNCVVVVLCRSIRRKLLAIVPSYNFPMLLLTSLSRCCYTIAKLMQCKCFKSKKSSCARQNKRISMLGPSIPSYLCPTCRGYFNWILSTNVKQIYFKSMQISE